MTCSGIMLGKNIQQQFYAHTRIERTSSSNMVGTLSAISSPTLTPCSTLNTILLPESSSMGTKISPSQTSTNYLLSPSRSSYHKANRGDPGEMIGALLALVRVPDEEETKGNILRARQNTPSVGISTDLLDVSRQIAASSTSAPVVHQVVTPSIAALENQKRKCVSEIHEFEVRGKRPWYMHFIFGKGDIERCRWGETQSRAPNQPNQIHTTPDTEPRRSRTKKTKADLLYLVQQATDTSSIFSNQTFQPVTYP